MPSAFVRATAALVLVAAATLGPAVAAFASFATSATAAHTLTSGTLEPPTSLNVSTGCSLLVLGPKADLSWTATPSTFASGYTVERWRGTTLENTTTVTPRIQTTLTETGLRTGTSYTWRVRAFYEQWTSTEISATKSTPGLCL